MTLAEAAQSGATCVGFADDGEWWEIRNSYTDTFGLGPPLICYLRGRVSGLEIKVPWHWPVRDMRVMLRGGT